MRKKVSHLPSEDEINYVQAFSREATIKAYANWTELSFAERQCFDLFLDTNGRVLDLGCGTGRIPRIIGSKLKGYLGIDRSSDMINTARNLNPYFNFLCEDILEPSFKERNFDAVLLMNNVIDMLHPFERRQQLFTLIKDFLSSSGILIFSSHLLNNNETSGYYEENYHGVLVKNYRSSFSKLSEEVESHGFEIKMAMRDYRSKIADWAYIVASTKK